jgi:ABC-type transport system involved in multi-copper enzyme maturation permease subunit
MRAVLERDFLFEASRARAVVLRTLLAAVVSATIIAMLFTWPRDLAFDADVFGATLFSGGAVAVLLLLAMLTPPLVVGSILAERENDTLPLVLATPVGPRSFAAAKLLSRWWVSLLVAFAAIPGLALTTLFGGVAWLQVVGLVVTALALSLEMSAVALWVSSVSRRLATAVVLSFLIPATRWILAGMLMDFLDGRSSPAGDLVPWLGALSGGTSPVGPFIEMITPGEFAQIPGLGGAIGLPWAGALLLAQPWWAYLAFSTVAAGLAILASGARLATEGEPRQSLVSRSKRGRRWFRGRPAAGNPVTWKEVRLLNTASSRPLFYSVIAAMLLIFILGIDAVQDDDEVLGIIAAMVTLISLVAAVNGAATFGHERSSGGYDLLRATLLSPREIVHGKQAGVLAGLGLLAAVPVSTGLIGLVCRSVGFATFLGILVVVVLFPGFWAAAGMWCGVRSDRPRTAIVRVCAIFAVLLVGFPVAGALIAFGGRNGPDELGAFVAIATPPASIWAFLEMVKQMAEPYGEFRGFEDEFTASGFVWTVSWGLIGTLLTLLLPRFLAKRLDRDRDS